MELVKWHFCFTKSRLFRPAIKTDPNKEAQLRSIEDIGALALTTRNKSLDGLRGWLSLVVCIYHGILIPEGEGIFVIFFAPLGQTTSIFYKILLQVLNGDLAVILFFVMSGSVLFSSLRHHDVEGFRGTLSMSSDFIVRRIFRIFPAFIFGVCFFFGSYLALQALFPNIFHVYFNFRQFIANLFLIKVSMYGISWSLQVELEAAPFILISYFIHRRFGLIGLLFSALTTLLVVNVQSFAIFFPNLPQNLFLFLFGMLAVGRIGKVIAAEMTDRTIIFACIWLVVGSSLVEYRDFGVRLFQGFISAVIVSSLIHSKLSSVRNFLNTPTSQFLGRISYSFYVLNPIFLEFNRVFIAHVMGWKTNTIYAEFFLGVSAVAFSIPVSILSHRFVELPGIKLGQKMIQWRKSVWL